MIRSCLRRCKRALLRQVGFYDLFGQSASIAAQSAWIAAQNEAIAAQGATIAAQGASIAAQNEALLRLFASEAESSRARSIAAQQEVIASISQFVGTRHEAMARLIETLSAERNDQLLRIISESADRHDQLLRIVSESADRHEQLLRIISESAGQHDQILRIVSESAEQHDQILRIVSDLEDRFHSKVTAESGRMTSLMQSQADDTRAAIEKHFDLIKSWNLDEWKIREFETLLRHLRRNEYLRAIRDGELPVPRLETRHPVAIHSNDTRFPRGCKNDNSIAPRFNHKLYQLFGAHPRLRVLDLGCAGGGFVRSLIDDGHFAVGLEGSDYPLLNQTGEWATIPKHLFTCDITKEFGLFDEATGEPLRFEAITAWELMEHIPEDGLDQLLDNLDRHLAPDGLLLFSIATFLDWDRRTGTVWHVTVQPRDWWEDRFARHGFEVEERHPFGKDDWLRGSGMCRGDWHEDDGMGFHIVLRRKGSGEGRREGSNGRAEAAWRTDEAA